MTRTASLALLHASLALLLASLGCSNFEDPEIVLDLRPLAVLADPAEVVVDVNLGAEDLLDAVDLTDLEDVTFCALVADPLADRRLNYRFSACEPTRSFRCDEPDDDDDIRIEFGASSVADPETAATFEPMCATLQVTPVLQNLLRKMVEEDPRRIITGVDVQIELRVETDGPEPDIAYTRKSARYSGRLPPTRIPNQNPTLDGFTIIRADESEALLPIGRCTDIDPVVLAPFEQVTIEPIVPEGAAEKYIALDLELNPVSLEEALHYHWLATAGNWRKFETGGAIDPAGNIPLPRNQYTAPNTPGFGEIEAWIVLRDERFGGAWFRTCFVVE